MAEEVKTPDLSSQDIDIDNLEVDILIIAKIPNALKQTCAFLTRRGWPTTAQANLSKALEIIADKRPDIVMVSLNHQSPSIAKLPELLVQTFNIICVGFVEMTDTTSNSKLSARRIRYKIFGTPSGPNFHRGIRRILAEKFNIKLDENKSGDKGEPKLRTLDPGKNKPGAIMPKSSEMKRATGLVPGASDDDVGDLSITQGAGSDNGSKIILAGQPAKRVRLKTLLGQENADTASGNMMLGQDIYEQVAVSEEEATTDSVGTADEIVDSNDGNSLSAQAEQEDSELIDMLKRSLFGEGEEAKEEISPMAILESAVEKGVAKICQKDHKNKPVPLNTVTKVGVLPVESDEMPGYIVIGLNASTQGFLKVVETSMQATFNSMGVFSKIQPGFWIEIPETQFETWAMASAAFTFRLNTLGHELAVAFFATDKPLPKVQTTSDAGVISVGLADISTDEPVNFKAYIHLKENDKYYLYLRNGRQLQPEQKTRLEKRNISELFMKSVDLENLRAFFATAYLKKTIQNASADPDVEDISGSGSDDEAA